MHNDNSLSRDTFVMINLLPGKDDPLGDDFIPRHYSRSTNSFEIYTRVQKSLASHRTLQTKMAKRIRTGQILPTDGVISFEPLKTGMGNQLEGMMTVLLYAMATKRMFLSAPDFYGHEHLSLDLPSVNLTAMTPHLLKLGWTKSAFKLDAANICKDADENRTGLHHGSRWVDPPRNTQAWLHWACNIYGGSLLWYTPGIRDEMVSMFGEAYLDLNPLSVVYKSVLLPKPYINSR